METTLLGLVVLLLIVWLFVRNRGKAEEKQQPTSLKDTGNTAYHAVSIKFDKNACQAAKDMEGRRFLSSAAPRLPLPDCSGLECRCHFVHHKDRRAPRDRRSPFAAAGFGGGSTGSYEKERRERSDRRKEDDLNEF
ncbi:MAG: hypothetical protein GWP62_03715 [Gammaproteobacteria bacterium]|jgi:hypothetical protein|nr:hypothetical protein [Gammaproteobacteria bacterium]